MKKNILIAEDHPLFRVALKMALKNISQDFIFTEADSIDLLQRIMEKKVKPDIVILDLNMPGAHGFSGLHFIRGYYPNCPVVVISGYEDKEIILQAMQAGAIAYIPKSVRTELLIKALTTALSGGQWFPEGIVQIDQKKDQSAKSGQTASGIASLTPQQFRILSMVGEGLLNKQIAHELAITEATVKAHLTTLFKKLGVRNRTQAVIALKTLEISDEETAFFNPQDADNSHKMPLTQTQNSHPPGNNTLH
ncbi:MAG: response regulator transcription factor [Endozoicomonadaceae bacterium]|nr:response regulator transcription factor [Endozoicomonadaceae bacterium]